MADEIEQSASFQSIIRRHMDLFPGSGIDDLYKLIFQAAMGSEHALNDPERALRILQAEADELMPSPDTPLMMAISPDQRLVRLHIRPYLETGGDLAYLARAFVRTSRSFAPSTQQLAKYWTWATHMALEGDLPFSKAGLQRYGRRRLQQGYPAVHHSPQFRRLYRPAYRVVLRELVGGVLE